MHYLVDGYNLLFKTAWAGKLEEARRKLIEELDTYAEMFHLHITIVFDAPLQSEELKRGHYRSLEIIFTAKGETADDYIAEYVTRVQHKIAIVTSDKKLAHRVKREGVFVESAHDFLLRLRKKSRKKKPPQVLKKQPTPSPKKEVVQKPETGLPALSDIDAWNLIFEEKYTTDYKKTKLNTEAQRHREKQ
jgi:predicted RNA-binding protein with PIN domain